MFYLLFSAASVTAAAVPARYDVIQMWAEELARED